MKHAGHRPCLHVLIWARLQQGLGFAISSQTCGCTVVGSGSGVPVCPAPLSVVPGSLQAVRECLANPGFADALSQKAQFASCPLLARVPWYLFEIVGQSVTCTFAGPDAAGVSHAPLCRVPCYAKCSFWLRSCFQRMRATRGRVQFDIPQLEGPAMQHCTRPRSTFPRGMMGTLA